MNCSHYYLLNLVLFTLFCASSSFAKNFPPPRYSANGYASDYVVGQMDSMIPIAGDRLRHTYFNPAIAYGSDNQGYADLGLGHRWIHHCKTLLGVYLFGGYTRTEHDAYLWVANPGIEAMGRRWDAHLNGYFSMGDKNYHYFNGQQGIDTFFRGHSRFETEKAFDLVHHTGNGADLKLGYQLLPHVPLRGYIGGYYFHAHAVNNIGGGALGLEYWLDDHIKSFAHYTYDNVQHSTAALGIGIELGGIRYHRSDPCIEERLMDPVERYLAELGHGSALPGRTKENFIGNPFTVETLSNIAFFSQNGSPDNGSTLTLANCTFEAPCGPRDFIQPSVNQLNTLLPATIMYFNGGDYIATGSGNGLELVLNDNQQIHGRTQEYQAMALGNERTVFNGSFNLRNNTLLESIIILPQTSYPQGVLVEFNSKGSKLNYVQIGAGQFDAPTADSKIAVIVSESSDLFIENSQLITQLPQDRIRTVLVTEHSKLYMLKSEVGLVGQNFSYAIEAEGTPAPAAISPSQIYISDSLVSVKALGALSQGAGLNSGLTSLIEFGGGVIDVTADNPSIRAGSGTYNIIETLCLNNGGEVPY